MDTTTLIKLGFTALQAAVQGNPKAWVQALDTAKKLIAPPDSCEEHDDAYSPKSEWDPPYVVAGQFQLEEDHPKKHRVWYLPSGEVLYNFGDHEPWCFTPEGRKYSYWCHDEKLLVCPRPLRLDEEPDCPAVAAELSRRETHELS